MVVAGDRKDVYTRTMLKPFLSTEALYHDAVSTKPRKAKYGVNLNFLLFCLNAFATSKVG